MSSNYNAFKPRTEFDDEAQSAEDIKPEINDRDELKQWEYEQYLLYVFHRPDVL